MLITRAPRRCSYRGGRCDPEPRASLGAHLWVGYRQWAQNDPLAVRLFVSFSSNLDITLPSPSPTPVGGTRVGREGAWGLRAPGGEGGREGGEGRSADLTSFLRPRSRLQWWCYTQEQASQEWPEVSPENPHPVHTARAWEAPAPPLAAPVLIVPPHLVWTDRGDRQHTEPRLRAPNSRFSCFEEKQNLRFDV